MPTFLARPLRRSARAPLAGAAAALALAIPLAGPALAADGTSQGDGANTPAIEEIAPEKLEKVRTLLNTTQIDNTMGAMIPMASRQMTQLLQKQAPKMPEAQKERLVAGVSETFREGRDKLVERLAPIYAEAFSSAELDHLVQFYTSPMGEAIAEKMPRVAGLANRETRKWGQSMAQQAIAEVRAEAKELGYKM